ncbi:hypothetical protein EV361DRAFT_873515 [Lentinula raphanica]|nr:hypothetical protein EV361DRAFT_873515 [Lentinula raphanica]
MDKDTLFRNPFLHPNYHLPLLVKERKLNCRLLLVFDKVHSGPEIHDSFTSNLQIDGVQHDPMNTKATLLRNFAVEGFKHSETHNIRFEWIMDQSRSEAGVAPVPETVEDLGDGRQKLMFRIKFLFLGFEDRHPKRFSGIAYVEFVHDPHDPYKALDRSEASMQISLEWYDDHRVRYIPNIYIGPDHYGCKFRFSNPEPPKADLNAVGKVVEIDAEGNVVHHASEAQ